MRKNYSVDIKIHAVLKAARLGILAEDVAKEIGIHTVSLYRWKKELCEVRLLNNMPENLDNHVDFKLKDEEDKAISL